MSVMPETSCEARREDGPEPVASKPPLRCTECGYEIRSYRVLPPCPMCRELSWEPAPWRPFTRSRAV
jgi:predicted Zn-ribbon and HTH transcriptional regulator